MTEWGARQLGASKADTEWGRTHQKCLPEMPARNQPSMPKTVVVDDCENGAGEGRPSAHSAADGTDGAGLASQIDVQARGEVLGLAHIHESCSEIRPSQCSLRGHLIF
ncbi:hypothetical protein GCM10010381_40830 [Streptomyces xantholiticus]|nr:hypothetical protein GCM10010381_40830 [Streptomyces xantholiticus]